MLIFFDRKLNFKNNHFSKESKKMKMIYYVFPVFKNKNSNE